MKCWIYHFDAYEQIDFIPVSVPLKDRFHRDGIIRQGLFDLVKMTTASNGMVPIEKEYDTVKKCADAGSDHGAVWAEFNL